MMRRFVMPLLALFALNSVYVTRGQSDTLFAYATVAGEIVATPHRYTFTAETGEPVTFRAEGVDGFDPILTVYSDDGTLLIRNDDADYSGTRDALLEAVTIPDLGTYTVEVSAYGAAEGGYQLTYTPGYGRLVREELFNARGGWEVEAAAGELAQAEGALVWTLPAQSRGVTALDVDVGAGTAAADFHAQAVVRSVSGSSWVVGMTARQSGRRAYRYEVNDRGEWRFVRQTSAGDAVLRDWAQHPAIRPDVQPFRLGIMAAGAGFDLFFNGATVGRAVDTEIDDPGQVGVFVDRTRTGIPVVVTWDELRVTTPLLDEATMPPQIMVGNPNWMARDLQRRRLIPATGELTLNVGQSYAEYRGGGVNVLPLASGLRFGNLAIGTTVFRDVDAGAVAGCGLILRADETQYALAYLDAAGGYGISERLDDAFTDGLYGENSRFAGSPQHHLLVIANGSTLHYYIDGAYVGMTEASLTAGGVGNAVVNFDNVYTACSFTETWVWRWD